MSVASPSSGSRSRARLGLLVAALVVVIAVVLTVVLTRTGRETGGGGPVGPATSVTGPPTGAPSASGSQSAAPSAEPSSTPTTEIPSPSLPPATATGAPSVVPTRSTISSTAPLSEKGDLGNGVAVRVSKIESVDGEAQGPGEVAGPALRVSIEVENTSGEDVAMDLALTNLYYGKDRTPASTLSGPGVSPLPGTVASGDRASGQFVFGVPVRGRNPLVVEFSLQADRPTILFEGNL